MGEGGDKKGKAENIEGSQNLKLLREGERGGEEREREGNNLFSAEHGRPGSCSCRTQIQKREV